MPRLARGVFLHQRALSTERLLAAHRGADGRHGTPGHAGGTTPGTPSKCTGLLAGTAKSWRQDLHAVAGGRRTRTRTTPTVAPLWLAPWNLVVISPGTAGRWWPWGRGGPGAPGRRIRGRRATVETMSFGRPPSRPSSSDAVLGEARGVWRASDPRRHLTGRPEG